MNNLVVEKPAKKSEEKLVKSVWENLVEKVEVSSFPYKSTFFSAKNHMNSTTISTRKIDDFSLLKMGFPHFPHSLLLLLLNN